MSDTTWSQVRTGDVVLGAKGLEWEVLDHDVDDETCSTVLRRPGRDDYGFNPKAKGRVTVVRTAAEEAERAVAAESAADLAQGRAEALLALHVGAEVQGRRDEQGRWTVPVEFDHLGAMLTHLFLFHGVALETTAYDSLAAAAAEHERLHGPEFKGHESHLDHVHTPDLQQPLRPVSADH